MRRNKNNDSKMGTMRAIPCPYCNVSKIIVYDGTNAGRVSVPCANCGKFYTANFETMEAEKSGAIKNDELISDDK